MVNTEYESIKLIFIIHLAKRKLEVANYVEKYFRKMLFFTMKLFV